MNNTVEELKNLIEKLSENNFNRLVLEFLKEYYDTREVHISNGPYDSGIDVVVFKDGREIKRNIQITVQKTAIEKKILEDVVKASQNLSDFGYLGNLDFFISQKITQGQKMKWAREADVKYGITLKIIDANKLAEDANEYPSIKRCIYEIYDLQKHNSTFEVDTKTKVIFDYLSLGKDTANIKKQFLHASILFLLYDNPELTVNEICKEILSKKNTNSEEKYLKDQINILRGKQAIVKGEVGLVLSETKKAELSDIINNANASETILLEEIEAVLASKNIIMNKTEILNRLLEIYKSNYNIDIEDVNSSHNSFTNPIAKVYTSLIDFLVSKEIGNKEECELITKELLEICGASEYLSKIGISSLFSSLYNSDKLETYLNTKISKVVVDTQILLRILCLVSNNKNQNYQDGAFLAVKQLYETVKLEAGKIKLVTTADYVSEVAGHILDAHKLIRFLTLPHFKNFGQSKNVFFNYYNYLIENGYENEDLTFEGFIENLLDYQLPSIDNANYVHMVTNILIRIFEYINIEVFHHPNYEQQFFNVKKEYEITLGWKNKERSHTAKLNDVRTLIYLSTKEFHVDNKTQTSIEPFLVTWDTFFYDIRKILLDKNKSWGFWYLTSPMKFVDRLGVMRFKINKAAITYNIISLAEMNFNYSYKTINFIDIMSSFFNKDDISDLQLAHKLIAIEEKRKAGDDIEDIPSKGSPLTDVLLNLRNHYTNPEISYKFTELIEIFENPLFADKILASIERGIKLYTEKRENLTDEIFNDFNAMIEQNKVKIND